MPRFEIEILLVEDDANDVELTLHSLRHEHLANQIHVASDGAEALEYLAECEERLKNGTGELPRLILLDLKLPKIDGLEVLERVKANAVTRCIPVVVVTSSRQDPDLVTAYRLGVNSYIQKPVDFDAFRKTVKQLGLYWLLVNQVPSSTALR